MIGQYYYLRRILDTPCKVCGDFSSGKHYNIFACDGCAGFFKRSIRNNRQYLCRATVQNSCIIDKSHRNQCRACRLRTCQEVGMNKDAVQHERGSRRTLKPQDNAATTNRTRTSFKPINDLLEEYLPNMLSSVQLDRHVCVENPWNKKMLITNVPSQRQRFLSPVASLTNLCESAAQLLFMNVQWVKSIIAFTFVPFPDQLILMEESWKELFILGVAQFLPSFMNLSSLLQAMRLFEQTEKHTQVFLYAKIQKFHRILASVKQFELDQYEFACLRIIVLFKTSFLQHNINGTFNKLRVLRDPATVATIQNDAQCKLSKYTATLHSEQPLRFGELLLLLQSLHSVSDNTIEDLFFRKTIGNVPIAKIISDMYSDTHQH